MNFVQIKVFPPQKKKKGHNYIALVAYAINLSS